MFKFAVRAEVAAPNKAVLFAKMTPFIENTALVKRAERAECTLCTEMTVLAE